jgi:uncharacterized protein (DUF58 family)
LQVRDFEIRDVLKDEEEKEFTYHVRPVTRGKYMFGNANVFINSRLGIVSRKLVCNIVCSNIGVSVYYSNEEI